MLRLNTTPNPTNSRHRLLQRSCSRNNHARLPRGKKKPTIMARNMISNNDAMPVYSSSKGFVSEGIPPALLSIQASSMLRSVSGEGIASGVYRAVCIDENCVRSVEISEAVNPDCSRRSKPLGLGLVEVEVFPPSVGVFSGGLLASSSSLTSSSLVSSSPIEQFTYNLAIFAPSTAFPFPLGSLTCGGGGGGCLRTELRAELSGSIRP